MFSKEGRLLTCDVTVLTLRYRSVLKDGKTVEFTGVLCLLDTLPHPEIRESYRSMADATDYPLATGFRSASR